MVRAAGIAFVRYDLHILLDDGDDDGAHAGGDGTPHFFYRGCEDVTPHQHCAERRIA